MDAPLNREEYTGEVVAALFKQQRTVTIRYRHKKAKTFLLMKFEEDKPRTDTVVREMVNADPDLIKLQNAKMHADQQIYIMRVILDQGNSIGVQEVDEDDE